MKKLLGLLVVLAVALPASADVLKNVEIKGEIETITSDVNHNGAAVYNQAVNNRVLAGLSAELVEDVTANLTFQHVSAWNGDMGNAAFGPNSVQTYENEVLVSEANVVLSNLFDRFELTVGRQFYGDEDSAVMYVGPNHYNAENFAYAQSLDAAKLTYGDDAKTLTIIAGKVTELPMKARGTDLLGADFRLNLTDEMKLQAYLYDFREISTLNPVGDVDENAGFYGAKLTFNPEAFLVSAEYARNFGGSQFLREHADTGYMVKVDGKVNVEEFAVRGAFLYENATFAASGNYTPGLLIGHVFGGDMAQYSVDGVRMFNVGVDFNPFEKWTFALDAYSFQGRTGRHSATFEFDGTAKYQHNEYVQLFAGLGYAKYGTDVPAMAPVPVTYKDALAKDNFKWQLGMLINF